MVRAFASRERRAWSEGCQMRHFTLTSSNPVHTAASSRSLPLSTMDPSSATTGSEVNAFVGDGRPDPRGNCTCAVSLAARSLWLLKRKTKKNGWQTDRNICHFPIVPMGIADEKNDRRIAISAIFHYYLWEWLGVIEGIQRHFIVRKCKDALSPRGQYRMEEQKKKV